MKPKLLFGIVILLFLSNQISLAVGQDFHEDSEIVDIRVSVSDVTWDLVEYQSSVQNGTFINFQIELELWNPYDVALISLGSSSCRWLADIEFLLVDNFTTENSGEACTEDYGERSFASGLSVETSQPSILILDSVVTTIPDGTFLISDFSGSYGNLTDNSYGLNLTISGDTITEEFEQIPVSWGDVLFTKQDPSSITATGSLNFNVVTSMSLFLIAIPIYYRRFSN